MSRLRQSPTFEEMARELADSLAIKYKQENPQVIFSVEEMTKLFYNRIMTPPLERFENDREENS